MITVIAPVSYGALALLICGRNWAKHFTFKSHKNLQEWVILISPFYKFQAG